MEEKSREQRAEGEKKSRFHFFPSPAAVLLLYVFLTRRSDQPGEFVIRAKMAGAVLDTHTLSLNGLLDCQARGETTYTLNDGDLVLNLKITIQMFNGLLAQMK